MAIGNILVIGSIILGLVSIPFLATGPMGDFLPTGRLVLAMNDSDVNSIPSSFSKTLNAEKFEKSYETAFGKFRMSISGGGIYQELVKPGRTVTVAQSGDETVWKIVDKDAVVTMVKNSQKSTEICSTSDGVLEKTKEMGGVNERFTGSNLELVTQVCSDVKAIMEEEVQGIEQLALDSDLPKIPSNFKDVVRVTNVTATDTPESVEIRNDGDKSLDLQGWTIQDSGNNIYTYPNYTLASGATVKVYNDYGNTTVDCAIDLCWTTKASTSLWNNNGDTATLKNSFGEKVDEYCYGSAC
ncbi:hypothetical protein A3K63_00135 [Candidatus Micrarchaeota archaeon RBG_16_49_10]|nr:MAG: hypothetical protein A3K63_00135 [Candidatus Micrarchaeota archaeon RBG_16_49_10]